MNAEQEIGLLPIASSVEQTQPATASMYWPLMTPSCLAKTKPSIRGAAGTDGSCVNPPWTHQSFQPLPNSSNCHIQTYGQSQLMQSVQNIFNPDGAYKMCIFKCGQKQLCKKIGLLIEFQQFGWFAAILLADQSQVFHRFRPCSELPASQATSQC